ncbi:conserved hypothetical protein [Ricinus communis]|uniref:Uncharacterized protein n=1 Tax=Ricinus communis TaxID=3988 RepID=B9TCU2_RICCO|nr:conserved hypothetical protein [Ricinus communis]
MRHPGRGVAVDVFAFQTEPKSFRFRSFEKCFDQLRTEPVAAFLDDGAARLILSQQDVRLILERREGEDIYTVYQQGCRGQQRCAGLAMVFFVFPLELCQARMNVGFRHAAVMQNAGLE